MILSICQGTVLVKSPAVFTFRTEPRYSIESKTHLPPGAWDSSVALVPLYGSSAMSVPTGRPANAVPAIRAEISRTRNSITLSFRIVVSFYFRFPSLEGRFWEGASLALLLAVARGVLRSLRIVSLDSSFLLDCRAGCSMPCPAGAGHCSVRQAVQCACFCYGAPPPVPGQHSRPLSRCSTGGRVREGEARPNNLL